MDDMPVLSSHAGHWTVAQGSFASRQSVVYRTTGISGLSASRRGRLAVYGTVQRKLSLGSAPACDWQVRRCDGKGRDASVEWAVAREGVTSAAEL